MSTMLGGRYQLVRELGAGGMGRVFQAVDTDTGRSVAAKIMLASSDDNLEALLRFQQEGAVLSTLKHPNIVEVYGTFLEEHTSCIIMELLEGQSFNDILRAERLALPRIKKLVRQVVAALIYAHGRGIVHRDIKPDNIMVVGDDHVKVTDFGIARILRTGGTLNTATGTSIGTPLYMAPEQIEGAKVDGRADIYSLGTVMYQMVTGQPPFQGDDPLTVAFKHVHKAPQPPSELNAEIPEDWEALILKALAKNPDERFQTAIALNEAIDLLDGGQPLPLTHEFPAIPGKPAPSLDTVDRILHPEITAPRSGGMPPQLGAVTAPGVTRPAASAASVQTPPPAPAVVGDPFAGQTVLRPSEAGAYQADHLTSMRPAAAGAAVTALPATGAGPATRKGGVPLPAILGGVGALLVAAVAAFFLLHKSSSTTPAVAQVRTPAPTAAVSAPKILALAVVGTRSGSSYASGQTVQLSWTNVNADLYRLEIANSAAALASTAQPRALEMPGYSLKVVGARTYFWRVAAKMNGKWQPYSAAQHFAVKRPSIGVPVPLSPTNGSSLVAQRERLCWSGVNGAAGYVLFLNGARQIAQAHCATVAVKPGNYHWRVAARVRGARIYTGTISSLASFKVQRKAVVAAQSTATPAPQPAQQQPTAQPQPVQQPTAQPQPVQQQPVQQQPVQPQPTKAPACNGEGC